MVGLFAFIGLLVMTAVAADWLSEYWGRRRVRLVREALEQVERDARAEALRRERIGDAIERHRNRYRCTVEHNFDPTCPDCICEEISLLHVDE